MRLLTEWLPWIAQPRAVGGMEPALSTVISNYITMLSGLQAIKSGLLKSRALI